MIIVIKLLNWPYFLDWLTLQKCPILAIFISVLLLNPTKTKFTQRLEEEEPFALQNRNCKTSSVWLYDHSWGWFPADIQKLEKVSLFLWHATAPSSTTIKSASYLTLGNPDLHRLLLGAAWHRRDIRALLLHLISLSDVDLAMSAWVKPWGSPELLSPLVLQLSHCLPHLQHLSWVGKLPSLLRRCCNPKDWL